jgi:hypothetical protein
MLGTHQTEAAHCSFLVSRLSQAHPGLQCVSDLPAAVVPVLVVVEEHPDKLGDLQCVSDLPAAVVPVLVVVEEHPDKLGDLLPGWFAPLLYYELTGRPSRGDLRSC